MNIYSRKQSWKKLLLLAAVGIAVWSLWYTNQLVEKLSEEERKKVKLWAQGTRELASMENPDADISFIFEVIKNNETVPVILTDGQGRIISHRNLDSTKVDKDGYVEEQLHRMKENTQPIVIEMPDGSKNYIYYYESTILTRLFYYPMIQLAVIALFVIIAYLAFSYSRRAEQNQVWVGFSKETAHQLGTPISSLMATVELLRMKGGNEKILPEMEKDVDRLQTITERFSKIGSEPELLSENLSLLLIHSAGYIRKRTSERIEFRFNYDLEKEIIAAVNRPLFEWVIENLSKNAIDAMSGNGLLEYSLSEKGGQIFIDVRDTGKGIPKSKQKTVFRPGYTTKKRGWGLGLSLSKRIIENYHKGKIYVLRSEAGKGTTFRIVLGK